MTGATKQVGVVIRRSKVDHAWIDHVWSPEAILPEAPETAPKTGLGATGEVELFYAGIGTLELYTSETANYRDNLIEGKPQVWVALRTQPESGDVELVHVTADPTEGETLMEAGADIVSPVPMPAEIAGWIAAFVDEHHVERVFHKRKRDKSGPDPRKNPGLKMREREGGEA